MQAAHLVKEFMRLAKIAASGAGSRARPASVGLAGDLARKAGAMDRGQIAVFGQAFHLSRLRRLGEGPIGRRDGRNGDVGQAHGGLPAVRSSLTTPALVSEIRRASASGVRCLQIQRGVRLSTTSGSAREALTATEEEVAVRAICVRDAPSKGAETRRGERRNEFHPSP